MTVQSISLPPLILHMRYQDCLKNLCNGLTIISIGWCGIVMTILSLAIRPFNFIIIYTTQLMVICIHTRPMHNGNAIFLTRKSLRYNMSHGVNFRKMLNYWQYFYMINDVKFYYIVLFLIFQILTNARTRPLQHVVCLIRSVAICQHTLCANVMPVLRETAKNTAKVSIASMLKVHNINATICK